MPGCFGTLTLNADGSYSYDGNPNVVPPAGATDIFVYTIRMATVTFDDDADDQPDGCGGFLLRLTAT